MAHIQNLNLLDKAKRHHKRARAKDPTLSAYAGGGRVVANGLLKVELPLVDGTMITFSARPAVEWRFIQEPGLKNAPAKLSPSDRAKQALNVLLNVLVDAEHHIHSAEPKPDIVNTAVN